jgi:signal transduction histidine kinase/DNA-binding response OmpR family regulator/ligand-binding sensor domain-containing protein
MRQLASTTFFLIIFLCSRGQQPLYTHYKWFKVEDGLPQSFVSALAQDDDGFLWIGTRDGLARYDGREFRIFSHSAADTNSISSNVIVAMYHASDNVLWIQYENGFFDLFDPRSFRTRRVSTIGIVDSLLNKIHTYLPFADSKGKYFATTYLEGIFLLDTKTEKITHLSKANHCLNNDSIVSARVDHENRIWLFHGKGLEVSDKSLSHFRYIPFPAAMRFTFKDDSVYSFAILPGQRAMMGIGPKLFIYEEKDNRFTEIHTRPNDLTKTGRVRRILVSENGQIYMEKQGGIYRLEKDYRETLLWKNPLTSVDSKYALSLLLDRSNNIWYGTNAAGLWKINLESLPFFSSGYRNNFAADIVQKITNLSSIPTSLLQSKWTYNFRYCYGPENSLIFAEDDGTYLSSIYTWKQDKLSSLPLPPGHHYSIRGLSYQSGFIYAFDIGGGVWKWADMNHLPSFSTIEHDKELFDFETDKDFYWIATPGSGLYKVKNNKPIEHYTKGNKENDLPSDNLTDIITDPRDSSCLWIGTLGDGLIFFDKSTGVKRVFTVNDGLPNNTIYAILADKNDNLWISTNQGISRLDTKKYSFTNFDLKDGLPGNEFNRFHKFQFADGRLAFGGLEGYTIFDPTLFTEDNYATPVEFTKLLVNNKPVEFLSDQKLLSQPLNNLAKLTLPYNKNFLSFEFAGLQFNQPDRIHYRYRLKGYDKDWIDAGTRNLATYTRLPPGKYTLLVNASNTSGKWSPFIKELSIYIKPPFWAAWWAYVLYAFVIAALIRSYWKYRINRIRLQNRIAWEQKKALHLQEVDEMKNRFFDNITHEFRTPLTLILTPLEKLTKDPSLPVSHQHVLTNAHRNAEQLLRLINQLLDISRIESGQMKLNLSTGELDNFIESCIHQFSLQAKEKNIHVSFHSDAISGHYNFDKEKLEKIVFNLLGNAIKFTPSHGTINVSLKSFVEAENQRAKIELVVADSGTGIAEEKLSKIFDRFYMADDSGTRSHSGTGIGLSLVKELTQLMKGNIVVKSEQGKGTTFLITLPIERIGNLKKNGSTENERNLPSATSKNDFVPQQMNEGPLLLIVEDNDELRSFIAESLASHWRIMEASNGKDAWQMILKELPEIVITDVMMPEMDGVELCRAAKHDTRTQHISFILLTAKAAHQSKLTGLGAGADEYITKPFHFDELQLRIHNLVHQQENLRKHLQNQLLPEKPLPKLPHVNDVFIQKLYQHLDDRLDEPNMDVEALALAMHMSRRTLNRKLKAILNISANDLIRRYRLQKAATLLAAGHAITQTAYTVGFETPSYFTQCFKEQYGQTPSEFAAQKTA